MTIPGYTNPDVTVRAKTAAKDSSHFYTLLEGVWAPLYGEDKDFGLADARKLMESGFLAVPSVTTILKVANKPGLTDYFFETAARAMYDLCIIDPPEKDEAIDRAVETAKNANRGAMDFGTKGHKALECALTGEDWDREYDVYVQAVMRERERRGIVKSQPEKCVGSSKLGVAGRVDDHLNEAETGNPYTVIDYKFRKSKVGVRKPAKVPSYIEDQVQLGLYAALLWPDDLADVWRHGKGLLFGISTTFPGHVTVHEYSGDDLKRGYEAGLSLASYWRFANNYYPRK